MNKFINFVAATVVATIGFAASAYAGNANFGDTYIVTVKKADASSDCCNSQERKKKRTVSADAADTNIGGFERKQKQHATGNGRKPTPVAFTGSKLNCLSNKDTTQWRVTWFRAGGGSCNGHVSTKDIADIAAMVASGRTVKEVSFFIPKACPKNKYAVMPVYVNHKKGEINFRPWSKHCSKGYESVASLNAKFN